MFTALHQQTSSGRSNAAQSGKAGHAAQPAVVQMAYKELGGINPSSMAAAVSSRTESEKPREQFNVATVSIYEKSHSKKGTATRQSVGGGPGLHAERRALGASMDEAKINGYNSDSGATTGEALHKGNIVDVDVYTELPPCGKNCKPYFQKIATKISGDVNVTFSSELDGWEDMKDTRKAWSLHLAAIGLDEEEKEKSIIKKVKEEKKEEKKIEFVEKKKEELKEENVSKQTICLDTTGFDFSNISEVEMLFAMHGVLFYEMESTSETEVEIQFESSASTKSNIKVALLIKGYKAT